MQGIELKNFYESPVNSPKTSAGKNVSRVNKADTETVRKSLQLAVSPVKKVAPRAKNILSDNAILESLDSLMESPEIVEKTAKTPATNKKKSTAKTPKVVVTKTPKSAKTPPASTRRATRKTPAPLKKTSVKSPQLAKSPIDTPVKTPKYAKKTPAPAKSTKKAAPKSTKKAGQSDSLAGEVRQVTIKLRALDAGIYADPQVLLSQLESLPASPERVDQVN